MKMTKVKATVAAVGGLVTALTGALADNVLDVSEMTGLTLALLTAAGTVYAVWRVPNKPVPPTNTPPAL